MFYNCSILGQNYTFCNKNYQRCGLMPTTSFGCSYNKSQEDTQILKFI
jgi:hypothetical protein